MELGSKFRFRAFHGMLGSPLPCACHTSFFYLYFLLKSKLLKDRGCYIFSSGQVISNSFLLVVVCFLFVFFLLGYSFQSILSSVCRVLGQFVLSSAMSILEISNIYVHGAILSYTTALMPITVASSSTWKKH